MACETRRQPKKMAEIFFAGRMSWYDLISREVAARYLLVPKTAHTVQRN